MNLEFEGKVTEIRDARHGTTEKGEWANTEFEVTELTPQNADYPQIGLFDFFKNGEYTKFAKDFKNYYPVGTKVKVEFNLKKNQYTNKENKLVSFYKTSAWKVTKLEGQSESVAPMAKFEPVDVLNEDDSDDLPF